MLQLTQIVAVMALLASTSLVPAHSFPIISQLAARTPGLRTAIFTATTSTIEGAVKTQVDNTIVDKIEHPKVSASPLKNTTAPVTPEPKKGGINWNGPDFETPKQRKNREKKEKAAKEKEEARIKKQKQKDREREEQRLWYEKKTKENEALREKWLEGQKWRDEEARKEAEYTRKILHGSRKRDEDIEDGRGLKRVLDGGVERSGLERVGGGVWKRGWAGWFGMLAF